jgi:hypothetical protein
MVSWLWTLLWAIVRNEGSKGEPGAAGPEGPPGVGITFFAGWIEAATGNKFQGTAGWTSSRLSAGFYEIVFTVEFAHVPLMVATPNTATAASRAAITVNATKKRIQVLIRDKEGAAVDCDFVFHAIGA